MSVWEDEAKRSETGEDLGSGHGWRSSSEPGVTALSHTRESVFHLEDSKGL